MVGRRDNVEARGAAHEQSGESLQPEVCATPQRVAPVVALPRPLEETPFRWGVASGDPVPGGIVLWTRLDLAAAGEQAERCSRLVRWEVAADPSFRRIVQRGNALAHAAFAHSVHIELSGLVPGGVYWYRFHCAGHTSEVGCTRTAPMPHGACEGVRFAAAGVESGGALDAIARDDLDFLVLELPSIVEPRETSPAEFGGLRDELLRPLRRVQCALPLVAVLAPGASVETLRTWWPLLPLRRERFAGRPVPLRWGAVAQVHLDPRSCGRGPCAVAPRWSFQLPLLYRAAWSGGAALAAVSAYLRCDATLDDAHVELFGSPAQPGQPCPRLASRLLCAGADADALG